MIHRLNVKKKLLSQQTLQHELNYLKEVDTLFNLSLHHFLQQLKIRAIKGQEVIVRNLYYSNVERLYQELLALKEQVNYQTLQLLLVLPEKKL